MVETTGCEAKEKKLGLSGAGGVGLGSGSGGAGGCADRYGGCAVKLPARGGCVVVLDAAWA
jgi:hypothetical protein